MIELLRTNDLILISLIEAILSEDRVGYFVADQHMSAMEGSVGFLQRRIMVTTEQVDRARRLLREAGLGDELKLG
jgi:Putative prokaryotic signal transducing protein